MQASSSRNKYLDSFDALNPVSRNGNAIDEWLSPPPNSDAKNPMQYWTTMGASGHPLTWMAKDFLSIPGACKHRLSSTVTNYFYVATSTDVERAFSHGGLT